MLRYHGLDLHKEYVHGFERIPGHEKGRHFRFPNDHESWIEYRTQQVDGDCHIALEVTGNAFQAYDLLVGHAGQVAIANPVEMKRLGSGQHSDRGDAERLAKMLELGTLPTIWVPPQEFREARVLVNYRDRLVSEQTRFQNQAKAVLRRNGYAIHRDLDVRQWLAGMPGVKLSVREQAVLLSALRMLQTVEAELAAVDAQLAAQVSDEPAVKLLLSITGLGIVSAAVVWARVGDPRRFPNGKAVGRYAGLESSVFQSGEVDRRGHISKNGPRGLRAVLVQAAYQVARHDIGPLGQFYQRKQKQLGTKKAIIALARKLLIVAWKILLTGQPYRGCKPQRHMQKLKDLSRRATRFTPEPSDLTSALRAVGVVQQLLESPTIA